MMGRRAMWKRKEISKRKMLLKTKIEIRETLIFPIITYGNKSLIMNNKRLELTYYFTYFLRPPIQHLCVVDGTTVKNR